MTNTSVAMPYRKKLIEVALPLAAINAESAREKSIRHGHPSTLHLWWARRPLAACRAVLFSSLVDDPDSDPQYHRSNGSVDEEAAGIKRADLFNLIEELVMWENSNNRDVIRTARAEIARCVASRLIETGALKSDAIIGANTTVKDLVTRGHCKPISLGLDTKVGRVRFSFDVSRLPPAEIVDAFLTKHAPPVLDPFAGGGSIPLEAQRLGLRAYASDLNPIPVLINKALIEIPPKFTGQPPVNPDSREGLSSTKKQGKKSKSLVEHEWTGATGLAEDVRYYGQWMRNEAEKRIGHLYPKVKVTTAMVKCRPDLLPYVDDHLTVIAWIWARTVRCPNPACGRNMPLVRSFSLSTKSTPATYIEPIVDKDTKRIGFVVRVGNGSIPEGTVKNRAVTCCACGQISNLQYVRDEAQAGRMDSVPLAIVAEGRRSRVFVDATEEHERIARQAVPPWRPDERVTTPCHDVDRLPMYGMFSWGDAFSPRQALALTTFSELITAVRSKIYEDASKSSLPHDSRSLEDDGCGDAAYADAIATYLSFALDKCCDYWSTIATWAAGGGFIRGTFARQALQMTWDFCECNPFSTATANWLGSVEWIGLVVASLSATSPGYTRQLDATAPIEIKPHPIISTDPPYYDNISYADLSDYFYVWLRRSIGSLYPRLFATVVTPKTQELIASPYRHDGGREAAQLFFETGLGHAFQRMREVHPADWPLTVYYAFKQTETDEENDDGTDSEAATSTASTGWETMLSGLIRSGFSVSGTWPVRTERSARSVGIGTNALASSIVLVCRPRPGNASLATRKEFITTLRRELPEALRNLQRGNIAPVDLAQAAIGPGMAVFTRYAKVIESDGSPMTIRTALGIINQSLDEVLAEQEGEFDGDTRWALAWFEQFGMTEGPFGDAETLSKAKNTAVNGLVEAGIVVAHAGKVRLVRRDELPTDWNPATDKRLTIWEVTQHLIRTLDQLGELGAAALVQQLGGMAEVSRDLAYRLYSTCERKKLADEALAYNGLVIAWPELSKLALSTKNRQASAQQNLFS